MLTCKNSTLLKVMWLVNIHVTGRQYTSSGESNYSRHVTAFTHTKILLRQYGLFVQLV